MKGKFKIEIDVDMLGIPKFPTKKSKLHNQEYEDFLDQLLEHEKEADVNAQREEEFQNLSTSQKMNLVSALHEQMDKEVDLVDSQIKEFLSKNDTDGYMCSAQP